MKYKIGEVIKIRGDLNFGKNEQVKEDMYRYVNPVEYHFRGMEVEIVNIYINVEHVQGYGVKYKDSREFFVHKTHISEV